MTYVHDEHGGRRDGTAQKPQGLLSVEHGQQSTLEKVVRRAGNSLLASDATRRKPNAIAMTIGERVKRVIATVSTIQRMWSSFEAEQ